MNIFFSFIKLHESSLDLLSHYILQQIHLTSVNNLVLSLISDLRFIGPGNQLSLSSAGCHKITLSTTLGFKDSNFMRKDFRSPLRNKAKQMLLGQLLAPKLRCQKLWRSLKRKTDKFLKERKEKKTYLFVLLESDYF